MVFRSTLPHCRQHDSNVQPAGYESAALPIGAMTAYRAYALNIILIFCQLSSMLHRRRV